MSKYQNILLLDCTLRDGGQGLEAAYRNVLSPMHFTSEIIDNVIEHLKKSDVEIIELGCIEESPEDNTRFANFQNIETISRRIPGGRTQNQMYVALYTGPDTDLRKIPKWCPDLCDGVRVILRYSELEKSLAFCEGLAEKGYKVFVQPMLTIRYTDKELEMLVKRANDMHAFALYFVDSYGFMKQEDIIRIYDFYNDGLHSDIRIGFHPHNNLNLAYTNTVDFLNHVGNRKVIIDSCVLGMGQGAGNLQSELIIPYLKQKYGKRYNYDEILDICENLEGLTAISQWGYSVLWVIPALYQAAYKYAMIMRWKMHLSYREINRIFSHMDDKYKYRYTEDNLKKVLREAGIGQKEDYDKII